MNLSNYLKEIMKELKLTTFPTQNVVINFTVFVLVFTAAVAVYLGALDAGFGKSTLKAVEVLRESPVIQKYQNQNTPDTTNLPTEVSTSTAQGKEILDLINKATTTK